jgi:hypothetical protein
MWLRPRGHEGDVSLCAEMARGLDVFKYADSEMRTDTAYYVTVTDYSQVTLRRFQARRSRRGDLITALRYPQLAAVSGPGGPPVDQR